MCGRFTLTANPDKLQHAFPWVHIPEKVIQKYKPRYNIAPSQPVLAVISNGTPRIDYLAWGLIPSWAKDPKIGNRLINARAETIAEKPSFRNAFRRRRCLILADGFYEWKKLSDTSRKTPFYIHLNNHQPFAFAGLWEIWQSSDGSEILSCTIITTRPNQVLKSIHNRMPVILNPDQQKIWLSPNADSHTLQDCLKPYPEKELAFYPVSSLVNSPANDSPQCIEPLPYTP